MGNDYLQVELGGQKRGLKFVMGTLYKARDAQALAVDYIGKVEEDIRQLAIIVYAALLSNYRSQKKPQDFTFEEVVDWTHDISTAKEVADITEAFMRITSTSAPVEGGTDTQHEAAQPGGFAQDRAGRVELVAS
jgi:hypothetical protein